MAEVYFVRHGESESNAGFVTTHPSAAGLTVLGQEQAKRVAAAINSTPSLIVTSAYRRTKITAEPLVQKYPDVPQAVWPVHEFTPLHHKHWKGTTKEYRQPLMLRYWERNDPIFKDGDDKADSFIGLMERIDQTVNLVKAQRAGLVVVYSHETFIRCMWWKLCLRNPEPNAQNMHRCFEFIKAVKFPNCGILKLKYESDDLWLSGVVSEHLR